MSCNRRGAKRPAPEGGRTLPAQTELAHVLGVSQRRVSAIEHSADIQISTLRAYLEKLGFGMEIAALTAAGERILLRLGEA